MQLIIGIIWILVQNEYINISRYIDVYIIDRR